MPYGLHRPRSRLQIESQDDLEEELHEQEVVDAALSREIDVFYERNARNTNVLSNYLKSLIFAAEDSYSSRTATATEVDAIVEYVVGKYGVWSADSAEVRDFRQLMESSFALEWAAFSSTSETADMSCGFAMRQLPQTFLLPPLQHRVASSTTWTGRDGLIAAEPSLSDTLTMHLWYVDLAGCRCSTLQEFVCATRADDAIAFVVRRLAKVLKVAGGSGGGLDVVYILRVKDLNEYIYGADALVNFRHVRDCLRQGREVHVVIEGRDAAWFVEPVFRPTYRSYLRPNWSHAQLVGARGTGSHTLSRRGVSSVTAGGEEDDTHSQAPALSVWTLQTPLRVSVVGELERVGLSAERIKEEGLHEMDDLYLAVLVELYLGTTRCCPPYMTSWKVRRQGVRPEPHEQPVTPIVWSEDEGGGRVELGELPLCNIPREAKLCFTLLGAVGEKFDTIRYLPAVDVIAEADRTRKGDEQTRPVFRLAAAAVQLFTYRAQLLTGTLQLRLWPGKSAAQLVGLGATNVDSGACTLTVALPLYDLPVVFPSGRPPRAKESEARRVAARREAHLGHPLAHNTVAQLRQLKRVLGYDPLVELTEEEKIIVWKYREELVSNPKALAKFLLAVNWLQPYDVYEAHCLIRRWQPLSLFDALELLDIRFVDTVAREQAVAFIETSSDYELHGCLLQLVQVLKYEPYHYSALARLLLRRFFSANHVIGHYVFWYMTAEVGNAMARERYGLLIEELLRRSPLRRAYLRQVYVSRELLQCALKVQRAAKKERISCLQESLALIRLPHRFTSPLHPAMECCALEIDSCKVMDSKKFPLWLVFRNYFDPDGRFFVIFKFGDDLRQDQLTLQLLELMHALWKQSGLDLHMTFYHCIATGDDVGMIEVVLNSETIANITRKDGGAQAAFSEEPLLNWLRQYNRDRTEVERCLWNFVHSVAGYTVASHTLGIGDRHNDNIMLRQDGTVFHIDFGHFLGNFKTKFGFKRETAPFIFTPMYAYAMGGSGSAVYNYFVSVACRAYNVTRHHGNVFIMLFLLMLPTGIAELQTKADIEWLRSVLLVGKDDKAAAEHYRELISQALTNKRTLINDYIHIMAH